MQHIRVGGAALNQLPLDWQGNRERILEAIAQARQAQVHILCLPELCISGYGCEDAFHAPWLAEQAAENLRLILPETRGMAVGVGLPVLHEQYLFNCAALLVDGRLTGLAAKQVLAGSGVYYEPRWFAPWPAGRMTRHHFAGEEVPLGDLLFDLEGLRLCFEICEDAWEGRRFGADPQADICLNPSASHFAFGKHETVKGIVRERSRLQHGVYVYANHLGNEAGRLIFDGTVLIASNGTLLAESPRFSYREVNLLSTVVDVRANRLERRRLNYPLAAESLQGQGRVFTGWQPPGVSVSRAGHEPGDTAEHATEHAPLMLCRNKEFARAVSLGLWDYLRKSGAQGFALSLSGGVDSAVVAVLCWIMLRTAWVELGGKGVCAALGHIPLSNGQALCNEEDGPEREAQRRLLAQLLVTVYQRTAHSSDTTATAARGLAAELGARHLELDVAPLVRAYEELAETALGRPLCWERDDLARQNVQARVRAPGIWLLANLEGRLLLTTGNRSEAGVGYATMDGDTCGGLAPIGGANKSFLRDWLHWMERGGMAGCDALPALQAVNGQAPTAELRPLQEGQTDEEDLMPYPVLDAIEQALIRDKMSPLQVWRGLLAAPPRGYILTPAEAAAHVRRFFRLWSRSQWKRERLAPSFHLDDESLDPRTWCRFPILSAGYAAELKALEAELLSDALDAPP